MAERKRESRSLLPDGAGESCFSRCMSLAVWRCVCLGIIGNWCAIGPDQDSSNNFATESEVFSFAGRLHALILVAVFSLADVLFICGRVGTVERRSQERHQFICGSTSNFLFLTDVVAESVEDMFPSFKCRCFAMVLGGTETMRLTLNGKEWHSRTTSTNSNVREVSP